VQHTPLVATRGSSRSLGHQPALDGVRGLAWFTVFIGHAGLAPEFAVGQVAMFVFFGLSGFLITTLLAVERGASGRISLARFYTRRALRLVPALVAFLAIWLLVVAVFGRHPWMTTVPGTGGSGGGEPFTVALQGVGAGLGYMTNWFGLFGVFTGYVPLGHLWSLAVEEQLYLAWAPLLVFLLVRGHRTAVRGALLLALASFVDVVGIHHAHSTTPWVFYSTDTRSGVFLIGGALGLLWSARPVVAQWWRRMCTPVVIIAAVVLVWSAWVFDHPASSLTYGSAWISVSLAAPLMIVALIDRGRKRPSILSGPIVTYIGRRSYGLYLWHYVWLTWLRGLGLAGVGLALVATLASAELSWRLVETPFLRLKRRYVVSDDRAQTVAVSDDLCEAPVPALVAISA
jgi:peptidoglycan/LPS O-acetylase OafA/YrhL